MKITKQYLKQIIKEEMQRVMSEDYGKVIELDSSDVEVLKGVPDFQNKILNNAMYKGYTNNYTFGISTNDKSEINEIYTIYRLQNDTGKWQGL